MAKTKATVGGPQFEGMSDDELNDLHRDAVDRHKDLQEERRALKEEMARRNPAPNSPSTATATATVTNPPDAIQRVKSEMAKEKNKARKDELKALLKVLEDEAKGK